MTGTSKSATALRAALIQASPVRSGLAASLSKAIALIEQAVAQGANLIYFGETWLPGYPAWLDYCRDVALWNHAPVKDVYAELRANSVVVPGPETAAIGEAAARLNAGIVIGVNEKVNAGPGHGTLYNTLLTFSSDGTIANHHRKLVPTYSERMVWGQGDGRGLRCADVHGAKVSGLICWEHWMPLARQHLHNTGEQVHVAVWPTVHEMHQIASRHYAFEGRCFVLAVGQIMSAASLPASLLPVESLRPDTLVERGGSAIIAPDGRYLAGPVFDQESVITADLDLREIDREAMTLDVSGHYARPDLFQFSVTGPSRS